MTTHTVYFIMVQRPEPPEGWTRVGKPYASQTTAESWVPFIRASQHGAKTEVVPCTLRFEDGVMTDESKKVLSTKFNMEPPK